MNAFTVQDRLSLRLGRRQSRALTRVCLFLVRFGDSVQEVTWTLGVTHSRVAWLAFGADAGTTTPRFPRRGLVAGRSPPHGMLLCLWSSAVAIRSGETKKKIFNININSNTNI